MVELLYAETPAARKVDELEAALKKLPPCDMPLEHIFTDNMYLRKITMPTGAIVISKIHKTKHPFFILKGRANVWIEGQGVTRLQAPHFGITHPGTRRVLFIPEECVWVTCHPTLETDLEAIENEVILKRANTVEGDIDCNLLAELQKEAA